MDVLKFLISRQMLKYYLIAAIAIIILVSGTFIWLKIYTRHGQRISVPDLSGLTEEEVKTIIEVKELRYEIVDSIFYRELPRGTVARQNPEPGSRVKQNRRIYLTMNAVNPEKVTMPRVTGVSLRQSRAILENYGLILGKISYKPDIAVNVVLEQNFNDTVAEPGMLIPKGSEIDLVLGNGLSNETTQVPNLTGFNLFIAKKFLADRYLNIGAVIYDNTIQKEEDSVSAVIWRQKPSFEEGNQMQLGANVDIWLTVDSTKVPVPDSLLLDEDEKFMQEFFDEEESDL